MKLTISAISSRGHVMPIAALERGLHDAGHTVRITHFRVNKELAGDKVCPLSQT